MNEHVSFVVLQIMAQDDSVCVFCNHAVSCHLSVSACMGLFTLYMYTHITCR